VTLAKYIIKASKSDWMMLLAVSWLRHSCLAAMLWLPITPCQPQPCTYGSPVGQQECQQHHAVPGVLQVKLITGTNRLVDEGSNLVVRTYAQLDVQPVRLLCWLTNQQDTLSTNNSIGCGEVDLAFLWSEEALQVHKTNHNPHSN
jgi:hypothetical protein